MNIDRALVSLGVAVKKKRRMSSISSSSIRPITRLVQMWCASSNRAMVSLWKNPFILGSDWYVVAITPRSRAKWLAISSLVFGDSPESTKDSGKYYVVNYAISARDGKTTNA